MSESSLERSYTVLVLMLLQVSFGIISTKLLHSGFGYLGSKRVNTKSCIGTACRIEAEKLFELLVTESKPRYGLWTQHLWRDTGVNKGRLEKNCPGTMMFLVLKVDNCSTTGLGFIWE